MLNLCLFLSIWVNSLFTHISEHLLHAQIQILLISPIATWKWRKYNQWLTTKYEKIDRFWKALFQTEFFDHLYKQGFLVSVLRPEPWTILKWIFKATYTGQDTCKQRYMTTIKKSPRKVTSTFLNKISKKFKNAQFLRKILRILKNNTITNKTSHFYWVPNQCLMHYQHVTLTS